ncbi:MAG TPA: rhamnulokinase family protein [Verrucomicrobiae bacterium]|nr:rhamnulokinase family protein [Verrucomicrobiae bacterium]
MSRQVYLGVDLGAESGRVMAGLWDGKKIALREVHRFANRPVSIAGSLRWNIPSLWNDIQDGLAAAAREHRGIRSVGVDTWGVDYVLLSKSGELLGLPFHYRDERTKGMLRAATRVASKSEIFAASGIQFMEINTLFQLLAAQTRTPELLASARHFLLIPDFLNWCLCGSCVSEFTNATTTQMLHPVTRAWSRGLLEKLGLPHHFLPEIVPPGARLPRLRSSVAERAGMARVPVVAPATHDTGSAVAAVPAIGKEDLNWAYISSGTWSLMGVEVDEAVLSREVLSSNLTNEGGVDRTYRLLKNIAGLWLLQQCRKGFANRGQEFAYPELVKLAGKAASLRSLIDPDAARFRNPPDMVEAIRGFCRETNQPVPDTPGAFTRCILESLALKYKCVLAFLEQATQKRIGVIHIVGGGSRNELLNQFTTNACRRPVLAGPVEATVLGNILMQARASREIGSLRELREAVRASFPARRFESEPSEAGRWAEASDKFEKICGK